MKLAWVWHPVPWAMKNCCNGLESTEKAERETSEQDAEIGKRSILRPVFAYLRKHCMRIILTPT